MLGNRGVRRHVVVGLWLGLIFMGAQSAAQAAAPAGLRTNWIKVAVPGAVCGDGTPYSMFVSPGSSGKLTVELMGGGACWSGDTCLGMKRLAWLHEIPVVPPLGAFMSNDPSRSPVADHTFVFLPYCTGDVHVGRHVASYGPGRRVHHVGRNNFRLALDALEARDLVDFRKVREAVLYGFSAGAIGALFHSQELDRRLDREAVRTLVADSPGLHFADGFWKKFTPELREDFQSAASQVGYTLHWDRGNIAGLVPSVCRSLPEWHVSVLQGSRDLVMSRIFGELTEAEHEALVYGPEGIVRLTDSPDDLCSVWVAQSEAHTFLTTDWTQGIKAGGFSALQYALEAVTGGALPNFH